MGQSTNDHELIVAMTARRQKLLVCYFQQLQSNIHALKRKIESVSIQINTLIVTACHCMLLF
jgi:hypothetical protein